MPLENQRNAMSTVMWYGESWTIVNESWAIIKIKYNDRLK